MRDEFWRSLAPDLSAIKVPMLVCGSFSDNNLHSRGSMRAFVHGGCDHARLYTHRGGKWATIYSEAALTEQLKFFRDVLDGAPSARTVRLEVREDRDTVTAVREEAEWPLARTRWRAMYLGLWHADARTVIGSRPGGLPNTFRCNIFHLDNSGGHRADRSDGGPVGGRTQRL